MCFYVILKLPDQLQYTLQHLYQFKFIYISQNPQPDHSFYRGSANP